MEGTWPLILDGVECGSVTAEKRGAYTLFTARALYTGEVKRISLYGGGAEGYLGVLSPDADGVSLTRKLTRSGMASFPERPEYAAEAGGGPERERAPERAEEQVQAEQGEPYAFPSDGELWYASPDGDAGALRRAAAAGGPAERERACAGLGKARRTAHKRPGIRCISALRMV